MLQGLSQRDNTNCITVAFNKENNDNPFPEKSNPNEPLFAIALSRIDRGEHRKLKDFAGVGEIEPMLADVLFVLSLLLLDFTGRV